MTLLQRAATRRAIEIKTEMLTKSGIMVGLGETFDEVVELMKDLRSASCDIMTIGQYLQPHARRLPVERYVTPEEFNRWREIGNVDGFNHVQSSPQLARPITRANKPLANNARHPANGDGASEFRKSTTPDATLIGATPMKRLSSRFSVLAAVAFMASAARSSSAQS